MFLNSIYESGGSSLSAEDRLLIHKKIKEVVSGRGRKSKWNAIFSLVYNTEKERREDMFKQLWKMQGLDEFGQKKRKKRKSKKSRIADISIRNTSVCQGHKHTSAPVTVGSNMRIKYMNSKSTSPNNVKNDKNAKCRQEGHNDCNDFDEEVHLLKQNSIKENSENSVSHSSSLDSSVLSSDLDSSSSSVSSG